MLCFTQSSTCGIRWAPSASSCLHLQQPRAKRVTTEQTVWHCWHFALFALHCASVATLPPPPTCKVGHLFANRPNIPSSRILFVLLDLHLLAL